MLCENVETIINLLFINAFLGPSAFFIYIIYTYRSWLFFLLFHLLNSEWMEIRSYKECISPTKFNAEQSERWLQFTSNGGQQQLGAVTASISSY